MTTITATTILRSREPTGRVLSTLLLRYPRCIHAEFMTHRVFSRNAASSRAIPTTKLIADVAENPFVPLYWGKNQRGMQAAVELEGAERAQAETEWRLAMKNAVTHASFMASVGAHKQIVNRLLEPFAHITVLVSATEWDNFLELRDHPDAEPHIQILARKIRARLEDPTTIQDLAPGEWHLPFVDGFSEEAVKLSVARCASTSYKTVEGFDMTLERAQTIYDKLVSARPWHASPLEHVAQADDWFSAVNFGQGDWEFPHQHGNFVGFRQLRHMLT